jgi:hypothetical protein
MHADGRTWTLPMGFLDVSSLRLPGSWSTS